MKTIIEFVKRMYFWSTGYSYTNLGRLFLRLFTGVMMIHFGLHQLSDFDNVVAEFPSIMGMSPSAGLILLIVIEITCSLFIMAGFLMRFMIVPIAAAMIVAEHYLLTDYLDATGWQLTWQQPGYLPFMFLGILFFMLLVGPGKISVDYFLSLHIIHTDNKSELALEEV